MTTRSSLDGAFARRVRVVEQPLPPALPGRRRTGSSKPRAVMTPGGTGRSGARRRGRHRRVLRPAPHVSLFNRLGRVRAPSNTVPVTHPRAQET